jgi:hypothetical protein
MAVKSRSKRFGATRALGSLCVVFVRCRGRRAASLSSRMRRATLLHPHLIRFPRGVPHAHVDCHTPLGSHDKRLEHVRRAGHHARWCRLIGRFRQAEYPLTETSGVSQSQLTGYSCRWARGELKPYGWLREKMAMAFFKMSRSCRTRSSSRLS